MRIVTGKTFPAFFLDRLGMFSSLLCSVHCLLMPLFFPLLMASGLTWLGDWRLEWLMLLVTVLIAGSSLFTAYVRGHGRPWPLLLAAAGLLIFALSFSGPQGTQLPLKVSGGFAMATAHFLNLRWSLRCPGRVNRPVATRVRVVVFILVLATAGLYWMYQTAAAQQMPRTRQELLMRVWQRPG